MKGKTGKFDELSGIYAQCSEKNREHLALVAKSLLQIQREHTAMLRAAPESKRQGLKTAAYPC